MKIGIISLIAGLILGVAALWGTQYYNSERDGLPPLHTVNTEYGDVSQRVVAHGRLQPVQEVTVGSEVSGTISEIFVDFNSIVARGEVIAQIEPSTFRAAVSSAEAELESAEAGLELARMQWERIQQLRERQFVSPSEAEQASATLRQAQDEVRERQHALDRAKLELNRSPIYAPTDGIVNSRNIDVGQTVAASLSAPDLFEIATDLGQMHIHANVSEADIGRVADGQVVMFKVDGYRERDFYGEVIQVRNAPIMEDNVVHYETIIKVDNEERLLKPGMTAEVSVITRERENVLRLRNTALRARLPDSIRPDDPETINDGETIVYLVRNGELMAKSVNTGLNDGVYTEILEGLSEGDTLAVGLSLTQDNNNDRRSLFGGSQAQY
jgi:HlyD family secretion protein